MCRTDDHPRAARRVGIRPALLVAGAICFTVPDSAVGQGRWYVSMDVGPSLVPRASLFAEDNDWSTKCDLINNPAQVETPAGECAMQPPPAMWENKVNGGGPAPLPRWLWDTGGGHCASRPSTSTGPPRTGTRHRYGSATPSPRRRPIRSSRRSRAGLAFALGVGVFENPVLAHMWSSVAAANGSATAAPSQEAVEAGMSLEQIDRASGLARRCLDSDYLEC